MPREEWQKINTLQRKHPPKVDALHLYSIIISRIFAIVKGIYGYLWVFMGIFGYHSSSILVNNALITITAAIIPPQNTNFILCSFADLTSFE